MKELYIVVLRNREWGTETRQTVFAHNWKAAIPAAQNISNCNDPMWIVMRRRCGTMVTAKKADDWMSAADRRAEAERRVDELNNRNYEARGGVEYIPPFGNDVLPF